MKEINPTVAQPLRHPRRFACFFSGLPHRGHVTAFLLTAEPQSGHVVNRDTVASDKTVAGSNTA